MNTLQASSLRNEIHSWKDMEELVAASIGESYPLEIEGIQGALHGFFIAEIIQAKKNALLNAMRYKQKNFALDSADMLIVVPNEKDAEELLSDLSGALIEEIADVYQLSWWGLVPYRPASKGSRVFGKRASVLAKMVERKNRGTFKESTRPCIFVMTERAFLTPVPSANYIQSLLFSVHKGDNFDPQKLSAHLTSQGYVRVPRVTMPGEFTLRGEVLDIFMPGEDLAYRITFDFDTIEKITSFSTENQQSKESVESLLIYPMKEVVWTDELVGYLEKIIADNAHLYPSKLEDFLSELYVAKESSAEELFYPLLFASDGVGTDKVCADGAPICKAPSILDYISSDVTVLFVDYDRLDNADESFVREYEGLYNKVRLERDVPPPYVLLHSFKALKNLHNKKIVLRTIHGNNAFAEERLCINCEASKSYFGNITFLREQITELSSQDWRFFVFADSENQANRVKELLKEFTNVHVLPLSISRGFSIPEKKIAVIQENEIFGRKKHAPKSIKQAKSSVIDTFVELNPEDFVVHVNYGIGKFKGIERVKALGNERDYIKIEYADEEVVFIPIEQVNLVQRYIGNEGNAPKLDRLGSKSFENRKNRVQKSVEDIANRLIALYSKRKAARGFPFPKDNEFQIAFEAAFPYEETEDQLTCIAEIKSDMEKAVPMDRLICGDVGYGKTELAMRAAFKAVLGGKQVALLAPTTILAEQHYENALERFEKFPVRIGHLSRFVPLAEQKKIIASVKSGEIDILVGTHRIIQKDIVFKDLGLMIIDEEQRFGVKDKERLKELKTSIDSLAMSATPIPRTLHMSLLKIRDMSILNTPPHNRQPIETVIDAYNDDRVASAIRQEVERGGQVFYLHNRVESLDEVRRKLEKIVPEMLIDIAHGQMSAQELDDIFRRFKLGGFHVLIATTIVENGIDIPNVNTIIIDRADMYGVSQLYQLRGRVGRSDRKAFAYLLYPENRVLSEIAMKRLQVISDFTELGSGFKIAMKDMEIRGAGNLLGKDQSGDVYSVGFDLYLRLLEQAIQRLSNEDYEQESEPLLELEYTGFIPETYITNAQTKMEIYKKIAAVSTQDELENVYLELEDRFGPIPDEVQSLLCLAEIRIICKKLAISCLKEKQGHLTVEFAKVHDISVEKVLRLMQENPGLVKLDATKPNVLIIQTGKIELKQKSQFIRKYLEALVV